MKSHSSIFVLIVALLVASWASAGEQEIARRLWTLTEVSRPMPPIVVNDADPRLGSTNGIRVRLAPRLLKEPPSIVAFVIGHEFGHIVLGHRIGDAPEEKAADDYGFRLAVKAGFDPIPICKLWSTR